MPAFKSIRQPLGCFFFGWVMKKPVVDLSECVLCDICTEACPHVFIKNDAGYIEVTDLDLYPEEDVNDVINNCRGDCISWDESH